MYPTEIKVIRITKEPVQNVWYPKTMVGRQAVITSYGCAMIEPMDDSEFGGYSIAPGNYDYDLLMVGKTKQ